MLRILAIVALLAGPLFSQERQAARAPELLDIGRITKINAADQWFDLRVRASEPVQARRTGDGGWGGEVRVGLGRRLPREPGVRVPDDPVTGRPIPDPRNDPRTGLPDPRLDPRASSPVPIPMPAPPPGKPRYVTSRVFVTDDTVIEHDGKAIAFRQLRVGFTVSVTGLIRGTLTEATKIEVQFTNQ